MIINEDEKGRGSERLGWVVVKFGRRLDVEG